MADFLIQYYNRLLAIHRVSKNMCNIGTVFFRKY